MPEPVLVHPSVRPLQRSIKRCEPYAEKQIIALRQKPGAIRHTQLTASATRTPAAKLAYGKIEIRQIGKQHQHAELGKILAPLRGQPNLQLLGKDEESPESSKAVCDWRSHRAKC